MSINISANWHGIDKSRRVSKIMPRFITVGNKDRPEKTGKCKIRVVANLKVYKNTMFIAEKTAAAHTEIERRSEVVILAAEVAICQCTVV